MLKNKSQLKNKKGVRVILSPTTKVIKMGKCEVLITVNRHDK